MSVALREVGHRFDGQSWLFSGLSLTLEPGNVYALSGPSGSGKSTLLSILSGWTAPAAGTVDLSASPRISWVFQNPHGSPRRTAIDHVALPLLARGFDLADADDEALRLLTRVGISHLAQRPFRALSGGEAQRLMFARGIASQPDLLLIDEPTAQLDPRTADTVNEAIASIGSEHVITVVATHDARTRDVCTVAIDLGDYQDHSPDDARQGRDA